MRFLLPMVLCLPLAPLAAPAHAQQTTFSSRDIGNARILEYNWNDPTGPHNLRFALNLDDIRQADAEFQPFDNNAAQTAAFKAVQAQAQTLPQKLGFKSTQQIEVVRSPGGYDVRARGVDAPGMEKIAGELRTVRDEALDSYVTSHFYSKMDDVHIMPDHKRIAKRYVPAMAPLASAIKGSLGVQASDRDTINFVMHFWQSIPYDTLENRYTSNGAGFETPYTILSGNKGDCDSKSVALAATLRALYPNLRLTMVYVPDHAFVGIGVPQGPHDYALRLGGDVFVLADPTGPSFLNLGQVAPEALSSLNSGQYSYQEIPF